MAIVSSAEAGLRAAQRATILQVRAPDLNTAVLEDEARRLVASSPIPVLVSSRCDVVLACGAAGVNLPEGDIPTRDARSLLGDRLVGRSVHSSGAAIEAERVGDAPRRRPGRDRTHGRRGNSLADREPLLDRGLSLSPFIPRLGAARGAHGAFMALAGKQHRVTRLRDLDGTSNRGAAVDDNLEVATRRFALGARLNVARDLGRVLAQWVVGGDDEKV